MQIPTKAECLFDSLAHSFAFTFPGLGRAECAEIKCLQAADYKDLL